MDPETVEALLILGELALVIGGGCAAVMGSLWGMTKPTILNAYSIPEHKT
jgi:hypothetical protein